MLRTHLCRLPRRTFTAPYSWPTRSLFQSAIRNHLRATPLRQQRQPLPGVRSFREEVVRTKPEISFTERVGRPGIRNQVLFFLAGSTIAFSYAAFRTNLDTAMWISRLTPTAAQTWLGQELTNVDLKRAQNAEVIKKLREWYAFVTQAPEIPSLLRPWLAAAYVTVMQPYADASEGKRLCWKICLFNAAIWLAWKVKRFQGPMTVSFMHHPLSGLSYTLLTSVFSHRSFIHLAFNCLALESFGSAAYYYLVKEQDKAQPRQLESTAAWHFLAFFVSAGMFSGLVSHIVSAKFIYPRVVSQLASSANAGKRVDTWAAAVAESSKPATAAAKTATRDILPSLGASGAVYAAVTTTALAFPESQVALFIPPSYPINIQYGVGGLVLLDIIGALRGWRFFDHWAHLGGAAFGVAYHAYGPTFWQNLRRTFDSSNTSSPSSIPPQPPNLQVYGTSSGDSGPTTDSTWAKFPISNDMFYYISFLRPPPLQSAAFGNILVTPQIANDLRTEHFHDTQDIYYSWSQSSSLATSWKHGVTTKPVKLTTWRQATAYKEIPVPLPPGVHDGRAWRLVLSTRMARDIEEFSVIDLCAKDVGRVVFPVMSMPIQFGPRVSKNGAKQEQIERGYRLRPRTDDNAGVVLRLTEQTSFDLDKISPEKGLLGHIRNALFAAGSRNILELGAGIGITGLSLAALRSTRSQPPEGVKDRIIMTDLESAMPLIEQNISANTIHLQNTHVEAAVLDWDDEALPECVQHLSEGFDAIIMADVTYNTASFPSLVRTLSKLVRRGSRPPLVLLGYKERDAAERTLWDLVGKIGLKLLKVEERAGAGGAPVEVWLGKVDS
ncbi:putative rhomboid family protein [Lyophyllum shimeji]|uniref:Rhomboid family protein n=1 Tax=Lyophyllum shimeji TaxID=47721 RepID=A0A9P3PWP3_LYOSH|nr:putative rhomboid family protein [Lyophyllum shimeji]